MKTKLIRSLLTAALAAAMLFSAVGCGATSNSLDLMAGIVGDAEYNDTPENADEKMTDFAVRLLEASLEAGENTLVSPLSVLSALAMTVNGADGETKAQMEEVLGMTADELNDFFYNYMKSLPQAEKYKLSLANSIWFTDDERFRVNGDFLQMNANYYGADIYRAPFDDETCRDINDWVNEKTDGMIPEILDKIPQDAVMYLVNALAFEAEWWETYTEDRVRDGVFTNADGQEQTVQFMYSEEYGYIEDGDAVGFMKKFRDGKYAFAAILPGEGVSVSDYIAALDGGKLSDMLDEQKQGLVYASMPAFETEYSTDLSEVLKSMGMTDAFDAVIADFSGLGTSSAGNIFINRVLHKTFITVGAQGAKAGAATVVEMMDESAGEVIDPKIIKLDRPFVYMLVDCETGYPFFIGAMYDVLK